MSDERRLISFRFISFSILTPLPAFHLRTILRSPYEKSGSANYRSRHPGFASDKRCQHDGPPIRLMYADDIIA